MKKVSLSQGWGIWLKAFWMLIWDRRSWSLLQAAEWMFQLNTFARDLGRHPIVDQIYDLKNGFIKYLYQHRYAYEVKLHEQKHECYSCDGTGIWEGRWGNEEECWKCNGTGVFRTTRLYAFRFRIEGKPFAWHQLVDKVDYPVELTACGETPEPYQGGQQGRGEVKDFHEGWLGCCVVWWCLLVHGVKTDLILFSAARNWMKARPEIIRHWLTILPIRIRAWWNELEKEEAEAKAQMSDADNRSNDVSFEDMPF